MEVFMAIITLSSGIFSGGEAVAEAIGARLNYPCISKEILLDAVEEFGLPEEKLIGMFQKPPQSWNQAPSLRLHHLSHVRYALLKRIRSGDSVYHGYAGHLLLGDIAPVIRVRVIADDEYRISLAMEKEKYSRKEAISAISQQDKQSREWVRFLYGVDWEHPSLYDVVINLECISVDGAAVIVEAMAGLDEFKATRDSKKAIDDQSLGSMVWAAMTKDARTASASVRITADDGEITISGEIDSDELKDALQSVAMQVEGVKSVRCNIDEVPKWLW
jgi:hypothetical protein